MAEVRSPRCHCGHEYSVHLINYSSSAGHEGCYGVDEMPKGKKPKWEERQCNCTAYRVEWPKTTGTGECVVCGIRFGWRGRERSYCPKCERRCPHCRAYARGSTHCSSCGKHRGLSIKDFVDEAPPLSDRQRHVIAQAFSTDHATYIPGPPRCVNCGKGIPRPRPGICDECFVELHGHARSGGPR
jgi:hypothetical protein